MVSDDASYNLNFDGQCSTRNLFSMSSLNCNGYHIPCTKQLFKLLVYSNYTAVSRCALIPWNDNHQEFLFTQGVQRLLSNMRWRLFGCLSNKNDTGGRYDALLKECEEQLELLYRDHFIQNSAGNTVSTSRELWINSSFDNSGSVGHTDSTLNCASTTGMKVVCGSMTSKAETAMLLSAFNKRSIVITSSDDMELYNAFFYKHPNDNDVVRGTYDEIKTAGILKLENVEPNIIKVSSEVSKCSIEYNESYTQEQLDIANEDLATIKCLGKPNLLGNYDRLLHFLNNRLIDNNVIVTLKVFELYGSFNNKITQQLELILQELLDEVVDSPCDYTKWINFFTLEDSNWETHSELYHLMNSVQHTLDTILDFGDEHNYPKIFDLTLDLIFSIALRNPNVCEFIKCISRYTKRFVGSLSLKNYFARLESDLWLPHLPRLYESVLNVECMLLHHPIVSNCSVRGQCGTASNQGTGTSYKSASAAVPQVGSYIIRVDISVKYSINCSNLYKVSPDSPYYHFAISLEDQNTRLFTIMSDGQHLMVFDQDLSIISCDATKELSFEFIFNKLRFTLFLDGSRFYEGKTYKCSHVQLLISYNPNLVSLSQFYTLTSGFRNMLINEGVIAINENLPHALTGNDDHLHSCVCAQHYFLLKQTKALYNVALRIHNTCSYNHKASKWSSGMIFFADSLVELINHWLGFANDIQLHESDGYKTVNLVTLWRMASENILALLSILKISIDISTQSMDNVSPCVLRNIASCLIGSLQFKSITNLVGSTCSTYHLQLDLDCLASMINITTLKILSLNSTLFRHMFSKLSIKTISDILVSTVYMDSPAFGFSDWAKIDALKCMNASDCIAIFTRRAIASVQYNAESGIMGNDWYCVIFDFLKKEKELVKEQEKALVKEQEIDLRAEFPICTCNLNNAKYPDDINLISPLLNACCICIGKIQEYWSCVSALNFSVQHIERDVIYYSIPKPSMFLLRLLLKHGIMFLCLDAQTDEQRIDSRITFSQLMSDYADRFCDWKNKVFCTVPEFNGNPSHCNCYRILRDDEVHVVECILIESLKHTEFAVGILIHHLGIVSKRILDDFGTVMHNFINALCLVDLLAYFTEFYNRIGNNETENVPLSVRLLTTTILLLPLIIKVIAQLSNLIKLYSITYDVFTPFMNWISLLFHSLVIIFGRLVNIIFSRCSDTLYKHILSLSLSRMDDVHDAPLPMCVYACLDYNITSCTDLYAGLKRLILILQDFKYDSSILHFDLNDGIPTKEISSTCCNINEWANDLLNLNSQAIEALTPYFLKLHPSLYNTQVFIMAVFVHLLDCDPKTENSHCLSVAIKYASQSCIQLMKRLQNIRVRTSDISDTDYSDRVRCTFLQQVRERCKWLCQNVAAGVYSASVLNTMPNEYLKFAKNFTKDGAKLKTSLSMEDISIVVPVEPTAPKTSRPVQLQEHEYTSDCQLYEFDLKHDYPTIVYFLLDGPAHQVCSAQFEATKLDSLTKYSIIRSCNALACLFEDVVYLNENTKDNDIIFQPLLIDLLDTSNHGKDIQVATESLQCCLRVFWYNIIKNIRLLTLQFVSQLPIVPNPYQNVIYKSLAQLVSRLTSWFFNCGMYHIHPCLYTGEDTHCWIRLSISFFTLLFNLSIEPMTNLKNTNAVFHYIISIVQPAMLTEPTMKQITQGISTYKINMANILIVYLSNNFVARLGSVTSTLFNCLSTRNFTNLDEIQHDEGYFYIWVKTCDTFSETSTDLIFKPIWYLRRIEYFDTIQIESFNSLLECIEQNNLDVQLSSVFPSENDIIFWRCLTSRSINGISFQRIDKSVHFELKDTDLLVYVKWGNDTAFPSSVHVDLSCADYLGGKLEIQDNNGRWVKINTLDCFGDFHEMRNHFSTLLYISLSIIFTSRSLEFTNMESSCCLIRLLVKSLEQVATSLAVTKDSECISCKSIQESSKAMIAIRYTANHVGFTESSLNYVNHTEALINKYCPMCCSHVIYKSEIEPFWVNVLDTIVKLIENTQSYDMVQYMFNQLLTCFDLHDEHIDVLLSLPNLGPIFCELFVVCIRKLGQVELSQNQYLIATKNDKEQGSIRLTASPSLHGMFLYRLLPPLQSMPIECIYASVREIFQSLLSRRSKMPIYKVKDCSNDPFVTLPHSDIFIAHRSSADFEAEINGNTLHITRATNMGGIVLFKIPASIGTTVMQGSVNFYVLSSGRFGITVAPADCVFGSVVDLFDRNDVAGFMTGLCAPFVHDVFAATIRYRVGDILSASFTIEQQDDGQFCLLTELLIAGNSIGSVLEVVYDPQTQGEATRRMSLVFIFQDPQTLVYNETSDTNTNNTSPAVERMVSRETINNTFRSETATSDSVVIFESSTTVQGDVQGLLDSAGIYVREDEVYEYDQSEFDATMLDSSSYGTDVENVDTIEKFPSLDNYIETDWDLNYDILDSCIGDETSLCTETAEPSSQLSESRAILCKEETWTKMIIHPTSSKYAEMFGNCVQLYQAVATSTLPCLSGLKDELVDQVSLAFDTLYESLSRTDFKELNIEETNFRDCFSWLAVLCCDLNAEAWKESKLYTHDSNFSSISNYNLPWLMGSAVSRNTCISRLTDAQCIKLLQCLVRMFSIGSLNLNFMYGTSKKLANQFAMKHDLNRCSVLVSLLSKCLLACGLLAKVMVEKGLELPESKSHMIEPLISIVQNIITYSNAKLYDSISSERFRKLACLLGVDTLGTNGSLIDQDIWSELYRAVHTGPLEISMIMHVNGTMIYNLPLNTKMFATCDYEHHSSCRIPSFKRHIMRRTFVSNICEHDAHDLLCCLLLLCPDYFKNAFLSSPYKTLKLFRTSIDHCIRSFDPYGMDYWSWIYLLEDVCKKDIELYSKTVDPLYGWQRIFYMQTCPNIINDLLYILQTEIMYCIVLCIHNTANYGLLNVVYWLLDNFIRHPLCPIHIRQRIASNYTWMILHTLMVNCIALPCKLAIVSNRLSGWVIPTVSQDLLETMFLVIHYCGSSAMKRVAAVSTFYGVLDLDTFTNIDLKRHDHATKIATASLVHYFASVATVLMDRACEPVFFPDDFIAFSHYLSIANRNKVYTIQYIKQQLSITEPFHLKCTMPIYATERQWPQINKAIPHKISSSNFRSVTLDFDIKAPINVILAYDESIRKIITQATLQPPNVITLKGTERFIFNEITTNDAFMLCFSRTVKKPIAHKIRLGCEIVLGQGTLELAQGVQVEGHLMFMEITNLQNIWLYCNNDVITWEIEDSESNIIGCNTQWIYDVEVKNIFISLCNCSNDYTADILVKRNMIRAPLNCLYYSLTPSFEPKWICNGKRVTLDTKIPGFPTSKHNSSRLSQLSITPKTIQLGRNISTSKVSLNTIHSFTPCEESHLHKAAQFYMEIKVGKIKSSFYIGIECLCYTILWFANGKVICPIQAPIYRFIIDSGNMEVAGVGFRTGDVVSILFIPEETSLYFVVNDISVMCLNFKTFYLPSLANSSLPTYPDPQHTYCDMLSLRKAIINAIVADDYKAIELILNQRDFDVRPMLENPHLVTATHDEMIDDYTSFNCIYIACMLNRISIIMLFSKVVGLNFDAISGQNLETPLMAASRNACNEIISYLICIHSANVNATDRFGNTALMLAITCPWGNNGLHESSRFLTVDLLIDFGCNVLAKNSSGCTVIDLLRLSNIDAVAKRCIDAYRLQACYGRPCYNVKSSWPGLLAGAQFVAGYLDRYFSEDCFELRALEIANLKCKDAVILIQDVNQGSIGILNTSRNFESPVLGRLRIEYIENCHERIRKALLIELQDIIDTSSLRFLNAGLRFGNDTSLQSCIDELVIYTKGLVYEVKQCHLWSSNRILARFVKYTMFFLNQNFDNFKPYDLVVSTFYYERILSRSNLFKGKGLSLTISQLQLYQSVLKEDSILYSQYSVYTKDFIAVTFEKSIFHLLDSLQGKTLKSSSMLVLPIFDYNPTSSIQVTIHTQVHWLDKVRLDLNAEFSSDLDYIIHCISDLLNNSASSLQLISSMIMTCSSMDQLQGFLPPTDSTLWTGLYITLDDILSGIKKIRGIVQSRLQQSMICCTDMVLLMHQLANALDDPNLKKYINSYQDLTTNETKLMYTMQQLNILELNKRGFTLDSPPIQDVSFGNTWNDSYSLIPSTLGDWDCICSAVCFILVHDRLIMLSFLNDVFKFLVPIVATILNQPIVEYHPAACSKIQPSDSFYKGNLTSPTMGIDEDLVAFLGPPQQLVHWNTYFINRNLIKRSLVNEMYSKIFLTLQSLNRGRPYFSIRVDRGIAATATSLKHTLWHQITNQILNCNPSVLRAKNNQRPFMVIFKGEGATDFGGPFQELLTCISNEVMDAINIDSKLNKTGHIGCIQCSNYTNGYGVNQDTVLLKFGQQLHPMVKLTSANIRLGHSLVVKCSDMGISCSSGCCSLLSPLSVDAPLLDFDYRSSCKCGASELYNETCNQNVPMELNMYEALGRIFAMCICMMNPLNIALNPIVWKKLLTSCLSIKDLADYDRLSADLLFRLNHGEEISHDLTFNLESTHGIATELICNGDSIAVDQDNVTQFIRLAFFSKVSLGDLGCTWMARGFNSVLPIGRFRMLLDYKYLEFMICGDPNIDLEVLRAHTVSTSVALKRDLFDVLAKLNNEMLQQFIRFVSGRSRLPPSQFEWSFYVEYEATRDGEDVNDRLPTSATCNFRLLMPRYTSKDIMLNRLVYAIKNCIAIDLDAYTVHDEMRLNS